MSYLDGIDDGDLPPTYTEAITTTHTGSSFTSSHAGPSSSSNTANNNSNILLPPSLINPLTSPLTNHLRTLPGRLYRAQQARATEQASRELDIITALVPHIEKFLSNLGNHPSNTAELVLVPEPAVPKGWVMTGAAERRKQGEVVKIVKTNMGKLLSQHTGSSATTPQTGRGEKSGLPSYGNREEDNDDGDSPDENKPEFDEWGRFECSDTDGIGNGDTSQWLWFKDEGMARRLATYLRPEPNLERKHVQATVVERKAEKSLWKGWGSSSKSKERASSSSASSPTTPSTPGMGENEDAVKMTVRAREITFRKENDFGVWESRTGFGIVCNVRITVR
ncbi:hypothetical protein B0T21DRAFT_297882 [Apiosordaria backusii]|uniref:Uncharacterized protein n=1 Tax=Apiosordaria backusii TaxID=314023 RepID=A0AA40A786_9PEZI|nr:hypothetical protein B0T21DRAFT_297882 [Apiosordaria backusii]